MVEYDRYVVTGPQCRPEGFAVTERHRRQWTAAIFATIALSGTAMIVLGPVVDSLRTAFDAPLWQIGLIPTAASAGYLLTVTASGFGAGHVRPRRLIVVGVVGTGVAMLLMGAAPLLAVFLVGIFLRGLMLGITRGLDRPLIAHFYPDNRGKLYSYYDMVWAVGAAAGPLVVIGTFAVAERFGLPGWRLVFLFLGAATVALGVYVWRLEPPGVEEAEAAIDFGGVRALLAKPEVLAMVAAITLTSGVEGGLYLWLPLYASGELPATLAAVTLSLLIAGFVPGRYVFGRLSERFGYVPLLLVGLALLVPTFAVTFLVAEGYWILPGILAVGVLVSACYPLLLSYATDAVPEYSGPVAAVAAVGSSVGMAAVPAAMGAVMTDENLVPGMLLLLGLLVATLGVLLAAHGAAWRRTPETPAVGD